MSPPRRIDLLQGTLDLIVLRLLQGGPANGCVPAGRPDSEPRPAVRAEIRKSARRGKITRLVALMRDEEIEGYALSVRRRTSQTRIVVGADG